MSEEGLWDAITVACALAVVVLYGLNMLRKQGSKGVGLLFLGVAVVLLGGFMFYYVK